MHFSCLDIFCHVIDNFGDAGVVYRFARALHERYPTAALRVFIDDKEPLHAMFPDLDPTRFEQTLDGITYISSSKLTTQQVASLGVADIAIEAFACHIPECYLETALFHTKYIINLEYLSAEAWVEEYHLKQSLLPRGTVKKYYFMPGFTPATGGLILDERVRNFRDESPDHRRAFLQDIITTCGCDFAIPEQAQTGSVFTYRRSFHALLAAVADMPHQTVLLCFGDKTHESIRTTLGRTGVPADNTVFRYHNCIIIQMPFITQQEYDRLLCCTDFNIVRGEDSLVRAIIAAKPFVWNAYLQDEKYQKVKVEALAAMMQPWFEDRELFSRYRELLLHFNDAPTESFEHCTAEDFSVFFRDLKKIEHTSQKLCYFIEQNCNLVGKFSDFIEVLQ